MKRCGKSFILELIKAELLENGADESSFICYNFENMNFSNLCNAEALRKDIIFYFLKRMFTTKIL